MYKKIILILCLSFIFCINVNAQENPSIEYQAHLQDIGWHNIVENGQMAGTTGESRRLETIKINIKNLNAKVEYQSHVQDIGWMSWVKNGEESGTTGKSLRLEAIKIKLTGEDSNKYDIYYRSHVQDIGWMSWVKNGEESGTTGKSLRLEAIEIKLVAKNVDCTKDDISVEYNSYIDGSFQGYVSNGQTSGIVDSYKSIEQINIKLNNNTGYKGNIMYETYITPDEWQGYVSSNDNSGVIGKDIEAIRIKLTDELEKKYDVYYRVHVENFGWLDFTKNGSISGTIGYFKKIDGLEIKIGDKDSISVGNNAYKESNNYIEYSSHVQNIGWQNYIKEGISGTTGESLRLEAIKIKVNSNLDSVVKYQTYVEGIGWQNYVKSDEISGTTGLSKKIEAISINLEGTLSNYYDIYYRTHISDIGWLDWAKNGEKSGSIGSETRIEAIEIKLIKKGLTPPGDTSKPFVTGSWNNNEYITYFGNKVTGFKFIDGIKYYFNNEGTMIGKNVKKVVDVSSWQGKIDWDTVKNNTDVDGAILRVGWGMSYNDEAGTDSTFDYNIKAVQRLNIPYGIYIYAYAKCESAAEKEAKFVVDMMKKYNIPSDTFVWYDAEISSISLSTYNSVIPKFINYMYNNGYRNVGVYGSLNSFISSSGNLNSTTIRSYPLWVAQYYKKIQYPGEYRGWQFTSDGYVDGINTRVDLSMFY